ncbi:MAG TPA: redoxin domain-containing protein, partial [Solirubrobacteraceae bacterium]|nr:redoxin domain-containing protein [Solirubrobacteraceae bacterium]
MNGLAPAFTLPRIDAEAEAGLQDFLADGPVVLVFAHADCPTTLLALRCLSQAAAGRIVVVAQETVPDAARLAHRTGVTGPVLADSAPHEVSRLYEVRTVPTAVRVEPDGSIGGVVEGWDRTALEPLIGASLPGEPPDQKPGCGSRTVDLEFAGGLDELEDMFERGFSDGLPVVPPTPERVEAMLGGRDPGRSLGTVPPVHGEATLERVAACAVLAGCRPDYFPLVVAAVEAALEPSFNAHGIGVTTQPAAPVLIVNGPARDRVGLNSGMGALGPGFRANATIGRALRLVLSLTGGAAPGGLDRSTLGHPGKVGLCIAENEERSPWPPFHVERGFPADASTV